MALHRARVVSSSCPGAKLAQLHYKLLKKRGNYSFVEIDLQTGRYHQIRSQFANRGCPIVGDAKYGGRPGLHFSKEAIALHCGRLQFKHPVTQEVLAFESFLPDRDGSSKRH